MSVTAIGEERGRASRGRESEEVLQFMFIISSVYDLQVSSGPNWSRLLTLAGGRKKSNHTDANCVRRVVEFVVFGTVSKWEIREKET